METKAGYLVEYMTAGVEKNVEFKKWNDFGQLWNEFVFILSPKRTEYF